MNLKSTLILLSLTGAAFVASRLIGSQDHESARTESYMNNEDPSPNFQETIGQGQAIQVQVMILMPLILD